MSRSTRTFGVRPLLLMSTFCSHAFSIRGNEAFGTGENGVPLRANFPESIGKPGHGEGKQERGFGPGPTAAGSDAAVLVTEGPNVGDMRNRGFRPVDQNGAVFVIRDAAEGALRNRSSALCPLRCPL